MSNTLPDIIASNTSWSDIYTLTGISTGSPLIIKNKSSNICYIHTGPTAPPSASIDGWNLLGLNTSNGGEWVTVTNVPAGSKVWIKGNGRVSIQVFD